MNTHNDDTSSGNIAGGPQYAFYGDDFTGATDTLAHLARAGLRTMLLLAPPDATHLGKLGPLDAIGVAGAARTMSPDQQRAELTRVGQAFAELGVRVMHYKVCSTFDSAPRTGSIGVAIRTLREYCANPLVAVIGGQPSLRRYCVFGELYAAAGADDGESSIYRIDRHPTMSRHPVTPMSEADLRVHLQRQGVENVQSIDWRCYAAGDAALQTELERRLTLRPDAVLFDVLDDSHLQTIGRLLANQARSAAPLLAVGASSVAQAYVSTLGQSAAGEATPRCERLARARSPVFVMAGSLSPLTEVQIRAARSYRHIELDPLQMTGESAHSYLMAQVAAIAAALRSGSNVLAFTSRREPSAVESSGALPRLAHACAVLLRQVLDAEKLQRVGIAGGDTSSIAVRALGAWGLSYLAPLTAGVSVCRVRADSPQLDGIELMLKGGQMGEVDLFEKLLEGHGDNDCTDV
ncbi:four-carbon acid sugar kinase family protein [Paraburkholderia sp. SIMBA_053]|uniref:four-carbon acid sugar kinase family protein n=1 Tax=Paraburkholderia sp. SIMBA_053 TaxID=3085794 RepID=UPI0039784E9D